MLTIEEMCNRRNFYVPIHPNLRPSDSELRGEITESSTFFSFSDTIQLSLEYMNYLDDQNYFFVVSYIDLTNFKLKYVYSLFI